MASRTFRELEADILKRGYKAIIKDFVDEAQNLARALGYLENGFGDGPDPDDKEFINAEKALTGRIIWAGMDALKFSEKYFKGEED